MLHLQNYLIKHMTFLTFHLGKLLLVDDKILIFGFSLLLQLFLQLISSGEAGRIEDLLLPERVFTSFPFLDYGRQWNNPVTIEIQQIIACV